MCFGFRFTVVMYRGDILAEWENIFDIADIDGNRRGGGGGGGSGLFLPPIVKTFVLTDPSHPLHPFVKNRP
jgi:hypothetical protein